MSKTIKVVVETGDTVPLVLYTNIQLELRGAQARIRNLMNEKEELQEMIDSLQADLQGEIRVKD